MRQEEKDACVTRFVTIMGAGREGNWTNKFEIISATDLSYPESDRIMHGLIQSGVFEENDKGMVRIK